MSGQFHAPAALPPGKEHRYALNRRMGGPQIAFGSCGEKISLAGIGSPDRPARSLVPTPTELSRFSGYKSIFRGA
jgi:hypothetical protein